MISCIVDCMDRVDRLIKILPSWAKINSIKEIVISDWSSKEPIHENKTIRDIIDKYNKIKIVRLSNEHNFHRCKAINLAYRFTNKDYPYLLKLDVDYYNLNFDEEFIKKYINDNNILNESYVTGGEYPQAKEEVGFLLVNKRFFEKEKGYNETFESAWGFEDIDLYRRLGMFQHLKRINIENIKHIIYHIPHDDDLRLINQKIKTKDFNQDISERFRKWSNQEYKIIYQDAYHIEVEKTK